MNDDSAFEEWAEENIDKDEMNYGITYNAAKKAWAACEKRLLLSRVELPERKIGPRANDPRYYEGIWNEILDQIKLVPVNPEDGPVTEFEEKWIPAKQLFAPMLLNMLPSEEQISQRYLTDRNENDPYANGVWSCYDFIRNHIQAALGEKKESEK